MITSIITLFVIGSTGKLVFPVIPLTIACYFDVAPGAIFANKRGGVLAAVITSALGGIILIALVSITIPMLANTAGDFLQLYGGNEFSLFTAIANFAAKLWVH
jgi:PTS system ascorbate-specific IIC component